MTHDNPILKVTGKPGDVRLLDVNLVHADGAPMAFELNIRMDTNKLTDAVSEERWRLIGQAIDMLQLAVDTHRRAQADNPQR